MGERRVRRCRVRVKTYTQADLAEAWASGYWRGIDHEGPINDAAIDAKNPHLGDEQ